MPPIREDQLESLRDALVAAYPRLDDLRALAHGALGVDLDTVVKTTEGGTSTIAWELIRYAGTEGWQDKLFEAAIARKPDNAKLKEFAARIGGASVRATEYALQKSSFDLADLEHDCRKVLAETLAPGLRVLLLIGVEQQVFDCLTERLRPHVHRSPERPPPDDAEVTLDPRISTVAKAIDSVVRLDTTVARRHVLVKVHASEANGATLAAFFSALRMRMAQQLAHDLVMLVRAGAELDPPLSAGLADAQLRSPAFVAKHLYSWVECVSLGQGWSEALKTEFKQALETLARFGDEATASDFYYAITEAIDCLRDNPDENALRQWIAAHR